MLLTILLYGNADKMFRNSCRGNQDKTRVRAVSKSYLLCYTREWVKREEKEISQHLTTFHYIYIVCHPRTIPYAPMFHLNVFSWSYSPTTKLVINRTTPHRPMSQHFRPRPHLNNLYCHPLTMSPRHSRVYQHLRFSISLIPSAHSILFLSTIHTARL